MYKYDKTFTTEEKVIRVRVQLQDEKPFFAYILSQMEVAQDDSIGTIAVDRYGNIVYSKNFVDKLSMSELKGVLAHESMHVALEHLNREEGRNHYLWNIAIDIATNQLLINDNFALPEMGFIPKGNYIKIHVLNGIVLDNLDKKSAEDIYIEIETAASKLFSKEDLEKIYVKMNGDRFDEHIEGDKERTAKEDETGEDVKERDWKDIMIEAWTHAEMKGNTPGGLKRTIDKIVKTEIPWNTLLNEYIMKELPVDYNWNYPSKRSVAVGIYLPSIEKKNIDIVVTIDTSASINRKMLTAFMSEVIAIAQSSDHLKMTILIGDVKVQQVVPIENGNIRKLREISPKGGGGTDHRPFYEWIQKNKPQCCVVINLTDGRTSYPTKESVRTKSVWVMTSDVIPPFGKVIRIKE